MRNLCKLTLAFAFLILPLAAQQGDGFGFLNLVNLVPGDVPCDINIAGKELVPGGLKSGKDTGWFMVPVGEKNISISLPELDTASGSLDLIEGLGNLIAIYLEPDNRKKPDGKPFPPKIRIRSFPAYGSTGFGLKFVSLCPGDNRFQIGPHKFDPKQFEVKDIPKWTGGGFEVIRNGKPIGTVPGNQEKGSFYLLVGAGADGKFVSVITNSDTQETPPWMKKDRKKPTDTKKP